MINKVKTIPQVEFLAQFDPTVHGAILNLQKLFPASLGVVCCENLNLGSPNGGDKTALVYGPNQTCNPANLKTFRLGNVPSRFQYPVNVMLWANS